MSSFSYTPKNEERANIENDTFFPPLNVVDVFEKYRLPASYDVEAVEELLIQSMAVVNQQLEDFVAAQKAKGFETLADLPAMKIKDRTVKEFFYVSAVYHRCKAMALKQMTSISRADSSKNIQESGDSVYNGIMRTYRQNIASLVGKVAEEIDLL